MLPKEGSVLVQNLDRLAGQPRHQARASRNQEQQRADAAQHENVEPVVDPAHWLIGQPFGSGFSQDILGSESESEPHNIYLSTLLRTGVLSLLSLVALTGGLLRTLWRISAGGGGLLAPGVFPALLAIQLIWFITWVPGMEEGIVTGLAVGLAATGVRSSAPSRVGEGADRAGASPSSRERR